MDWKPGDIISRAQGCLLGQLAGDALGSLVEFRGPEDIRREYPNGPQKVSGTEGPSRDNRTEPNRKSETWEQKLERGT